MVPRGEEGELIVGVEENGRYLRKGRIDSCEEEIILEGEIIVQGR